MKNILQGLRDQRSVRKALASGAPAYCQRAFALLAGGEVIYTTEEERIFGEIDRRRKATAALNKSDLTIYYSPKPKSTKPGNKPAHGEVKEFDAARIAYHTSISDYWGRFLHLLASDSGAENILELGTCAGISGCYLSSAPSCRNFWTIEASSDLCEIARTNIAAVSSNFEVRNGLFDEQLDVLLPQISENTLDLVWIDGHHEKVATLHYYRRLRPYLRFGAIVLLDDIGWSRDMRECWEEFAKEPGLSMAFDLKTLKGMAIWHGGDIKPTVRSIAKPFGSIKVGNPQGWGS